MAGVTIYGLTDPRDQQVYYVGKTVQSPTVRLHQHISTTQRHRETHPRGCWIRRLLEEGTSPGIVVLETVDSEHWQAAEKRWIDHFRAKGAPLVNDAPAGVGGTRSHVIPWTPELESRLGVEADAIVAEDLGVTRKAVSYRRRQLGIPASYDLSRMKPPPPMGGWNKREIPADVLARLGSVPDYVLAQEAGFNKSQIARARHERSIPSFAQQTGQTGKYAQGHYPTRWLKNKDQ